MPHAAKQKKGPSTSMLTEEETSHEESSNAARVTSNPSTSVLTETEGEASQDENSTQEESELEQVVYINHTCPHAPQPVYNNMYMSYMEGPRWTGWLMMCYIIDCSNGYSGAITFWNVSLLPSQNAKSVK